MTTANPLQIEVDVQERILAMDTVRSLVGKNAKFTAVDDQLAIRSGSLLKTDPYPGLIINLQTIEHPHKDLTNGGNLPIATVEISAISFSKAEGWALRNAVAFDGGDPNDPTRTTGLDRWQDTSKQIFGVNLTSDELDIQDIPIDGTDRVLWFVDTSYRIEFRERIA